MVGALHKDKHSAGKLMVQGARTMGEVLAAIAKGYDLIASSYPMQLTLEGMAYALPMSPRETAQGINHSEHHINNHFARALLTCVETSMWNQAALVRTVHVLHLVQSKTRLKFLQNIAF